MNQTSPWCVIDALKKVGKEQRATSAARAL
jgi:hypothetical protein